LEFKVSFDVSIADYFGRFDPADYLDIDFGLQLLPRNVNACALVDLVLILHHTLELFD
jgi:hypothetical protein